MEDLLNTKKIQYVPDPKNDRRCYRDGQLVSENPFILIPEVVNDEVVGAYKIDFRPGASWGKAFEEEYLETLFQHAGVSKTALLKIALARDLEEFDDKTKLINWVLTLMTAGGFVDMPRYAIETNRVAYFENTSDGLVGKLGIGDVDGDGYNRTLAYLARNAHSEGVATFLKGFDQSQSALAQKVAGVKMGANPVPAPIYFDCGLPICDQRLVADFDARGMKALKDRIEEIFRVNGKTVDQYLLLPVRGKGGEGLGLIYVDNAFSGRPLSIEKYQSIVCVLGNMLSRLPQ